MPKKLLIFLTDPLAVYYAKGEIRTRYYNPGNFFSEVHFISPSLHEVAADKVQTLVGDAKLVIHALGPSYYATSWLPSGRIASILNVVRPDVVRAYDPGLRGSLAVYWGARYHIPSVVSVHANLDEQRRAERRPLHYVRILFERYTLPRATAVVCVTHHVAKYAARRGARHPTVIYNRVYLDDFKTNRAFLDRDRVGITILCVGRLAPQKYQECLIRAVRDLKARLVLIGDGELRGPLERLVHELGMDHQVSFRSSVLHADIPSYYRDADIFAIATHYEGFCIPVLEAMAAGLPVVASRIGPIEEILGDAGYLVENLPSAFTDALERLIEDEGVRRELGARGALRAHEMDGSTMEQREQTMYEAVCAS